jgi:hypothetical protein
MRTVQGSSVVTTERVERVASYRVYGGDLNEITTEVDELVETARSVCPLAGQCAIRSTCSKFIEEGYGASAAGLLAPELTVEGVDVSVSDNATDCPQQDACQYIVLEVEDTF